MRTYFPWMGCLAGVLAIAAIGCEGAPETDVSARRFGLEPFQSCDELEAYLEEAALESLTRQYYGWAVGGMGREVGLDDAAEAGGAEGEPSSEPPASSGGLSETNVQEAGVDEPDFLKTDDQYLYLLHGQKLVILAAFPADETAIVSETTLQGSPSQLLVSGDLAVVFAWEAVSSGGGGDVPVSDAKSDAIAWAPYARQRVTVLDIADRAAPSVVRSSLIDGALLGARLVGRSVRVLTHFAAPVPVVWEVDPGVPYPEYPTCYEDGGAETRPVGEPDDTEPPPEPTPEEGRRRAGVSEEDCDAAWEAWQEEYAAYEEAYAEAVREASRSAISALTLDELLAHVVTGEDDRLISECTSVYRTDSFGGYGLVSVSTIDLDAPGDVLDATTVLGEWGTVYASEEQLYLAMPHYPTWDYASLPEADAPLVWTAIHQFDIGADPRAAAYVASGEIEGWIYGPFAMDEHDGHLRIATTVDTMIDPETWETERSNTFAVMAPVEDTLEVVGRIDGIAPGEQIMAARLFDDRGYLVTFRQVDPLFALDLRDPENPTITGELEIPGFSQYVHPLGDRYLLTVGTAISEDGEWLGAKLSIFDVSDPAAPALAHEESLGQGSSEAQYDHHALTFVATGEAEGILALPMSDWSTGDGAATLLLFDVSGTDGIAPRGEVSHADLYVDDEAYYCGWRDVRRGVLSQDHVYSVSTAGYKVSRLSDLDEVAQGTFGETDLCGYGYAEGSDSVEGGKAGGSDDATCPANDGDEGECGK